MAGKRVGLNIYRIRDTMDRRPVTRPDEVILPEENLVAHDLPARLEFAGKLFVMRPERVKASWADFLEQGLGRLDEIAANVANGAVLVIRPRRRASGYFAIPFGAGRHLLRPGSYMWNYGLQVALNLVYKS